MSTLTNDLEDDVRSKPAPIKTSAFPETNVEQTPDGAFRCSCS